MICTLFLTSNCFAQEFLEYMQTSNRTKDYLNRKFNLFVSKRDSKNISPIITPTDTSFSVNRKPDPDEEPIESHSTKKSRRNKFGFQRSHKKFPNLDAQLGLYNQDFKALKFLDQVSINACRLTNFDLSNSLFRSDLKISNSIFKSEAIFSSAIFQKDLSISETAFLENLRFRGTMFEGDFSFTNNSLRNHTMSFMNATFKRNAFFSGLTPAFGILDPDGYKDLDFSYAKFEGERTEFYRIKFSGKPNFNNCTFNSGNVFQSVSLPDSLNFTEVKFTIPASEMFDFRNCYYSGAKTKSNKCVIFLYGTDASKIILPFDRFELGGFDGNLEKTDKTEIFDEYSRTVVESLRKNCFEAGMKDSAEGWDIYLRKMQTINSWGWRTGTFFNTINRYWWNFGYEKRYILWYWLPGLFTIFCLINFFRRKSFVHFYKDDELGENHGPHLSYDLQKSKPSFTYIFFLTAILYFGLKIRHSAVDYSKTGWVFYLYFMYLVGSIHLAFAFSYILNVY